jgi:hypothetical protein
MAAAAAPARASHVQVQPAASPAPAAGWPAGGPGDRPVMAQPQAGSAASEAEDSEADSPAKPLRPTRMSLTRTVTAKFKFNFEIAKSRSS